MTDATIDISKVPLAEPEFHDAGANEDVYRVHKSYGSVEFRVAAGTPVKRQDQRWTNPPSRDPQSIFPNMEVRDEAIVLPFCDIIEMIVARADPVDLAKSLWENEEVRDEFRSCLSREYNEAHVVDADRRKFLAQVKEAVHSKSIGELTDKISHLEYEARKQWQNVHGDERYNAHYRGVLESIERLRGPEARAEIESRHGERWSRRLPDEDDFQIGKKHWNECRDFWRAKTLELFPPPIVPAAKPDEDPIL